MMLCMLLGSIDITEFCEMCTLKFLGSFPGFRGESGFCRTRMRMVYPDSG